MCVSSRPDAHFNFFLSFRLSMFIKHRKDKKLWGALVRDIPLNEKKKTKKRTTTKKEFLKRVAADCSRLM